MESLLRKILFICLFLFGIIGIFVYTWTSFLKKGEVLENRFPLLYTNSFTPDEINNYTWVDTTYKEKYSTLKWNMIRSKRLEGFNSPSPIIERRSYEKRLSLYESFAGLPSYRWIEDASGNEIDTQEKLFARFGPVDTEQEAVSFVAVQNDNLVESSTSTLMGSTIPTDDGFLVQVFFYYPWGCSGKNYFPQGIIYHVGTDGKVSKIAEESKKIDTNKNTRPCF